MNWDVSLTALVFPLYILLTGLTVTVLIDPYISRNHRWIMLIIVALSAVLIIQNLAEDYLAGGPPHWFWRTTLAILGYTIRPIFLVLFLYIVQPGKNHLGSWGLVILNWAIHMTAYFSHLCFWINDINHYEAGPLAHTCLIISLILMLNLLFLSIRNYRTSHKLSSLNPSMMVILILISVILDANVGTVPQPIPFLTFAVVTSSVFYYIWLHLKFVSDHEDDLRARQRIQIMLSQIQPHFLFNTLSAIQFLCESDPKMAAKTTAKFSRYL